MMTSSVDTDSSSATNDLFRIGTIANLTGISVERLRAWERRYGVAPVYRSGKTRFYSQEQLEWLQKVKRLIDQGHPISTLVGLDAEALETRLASQREVAGEVVAQIFAGGDRPERVFGGRLIVIASGVPGAQTTQRAAVQ